MNYRQLINSWHVKATTDDYFSRFVFEYLAFIAHLKTQLYSSNDKDREAIQKLKQDQDIKQRYLERIKTNAVLEKDWKYIKKKLHKIRLGNASRDLLDVDEIIWWNCSSNEVNQKTSEEEKRVNGVIYSLEDWGNMVEFWYSVRNNLFHGAKNPSNPRDQFAVKYSYKTLKELMELLLNE